MKTHQCFAGAVPKLVWSSTLIFILAVVISFTANGQTSTAITGRVSDQTGAMVPKAHVLAHNELTNQDIMTISTSTGDFSFTNIRPGVYDVSATASGFNTASETGVNLHLDDVVTVKLILKPGSAKESVTVHADDMQLDLTHASRGETFTQDELEQSPFDAGNALMLANTEPGVSFKGTHIAGEDWVRPFDQNSINQFSTNGGASNSNDFQIDGAPDNTNTFGSRNVGYVPPVASIQEMKFISNPYDAQYGHTGGGIFDMVTKYGTNKIHGQVYEDARRTWLDANTELNDAQALSKSSDKRDEYGFELDGPLVIPHFYDGHNKTFFELQMQKYKENTPLSGVDSVPALSPGSTTEPAWKTGDFSGAFYWGTNGATQENIYNPYELSTDGGATYFDPTTIETPGKGIRQQFPNNQFPTSLMNATSKAILSYLPLPNRTTPSNQSWGADNYAWQVTATVPYDNVVARIDHNFGDKDRTYLRFAWSKNWQNGDDNNGIPGAAAAGVFPLVFQNHLFTLNEQHTFKANSLFGLTLTFARYAYNQNQGPTPFALSNIGLGSLASEVTQQIFPQIAISGVGGVTTFGDNASNGGNKLTITNTISAMPMWTYVHGAHTIKVGADYRLQRASSYTGGATSGTFSDGCFWTQKYNYSGCYTAQGSGLASFLTGIMDSGSIYTGVRQYFTYPYYAPFFQDDWKVSPRLTINLGLRWDFQVPPTESANKNNGAFDSTDQNPVQSSVTALPANISLFGGMTFAGVNGQPRSFFRMERLLIQPRVGFNFSLDSKTVLRGGIGTTYGSTSAQGYDYGFTATTSYVSSTNSGQSTYGGTPISNPFPTVTKPHGSSLGLESYLGNGFSFVNPSYKMPGVLNYSFGLERQIDQHTSVNVSYVGTRGFDMTSSSGINLVSRQYAASCNMEMGATAATYDECITNSGVTNNHWVTNPFKGVAAFSTANTGNLSGYYTSKLLSANIYTRPYPEFGSITEADQNDGYTEYDSLQASVSHHYNNSLTFHGSFVWSKQMDGGGWADQTYGIRAHYLDKSDQKWRWTANADWHLPVGRGRAYLGSSNKLINTAVGNWIIGAIYTYEAGLPAPMTRGGPSNGLEVVNKSHYGRHNRVETQRVLRGASKCIGWYDPNPAVNDAGGLSAGNSAYTLGDASGNDYEGCEVNSTGTGHVYDYIVRPSYAVVKNVSDPGVYEPNGQNLDVSLSKSFDVYKTMKLQVRFEGYNVMNHPSWQGEDYWWDAWDSHAGTINKYYDGQTNIPRNVQLSAKIIW